MTRAQVRETTYLHQLDRHRRINSLACRPGDGNQSLDSLVSMKVIVRIPHSLWKVGWKAHQRTDEEHCTVLSDVLALGNDLELLLVILTIASFDLQGDQIMPEVATLRKNGKTSSVRSLDWEGGTIRDCGFVALMGLFCCFEVDLGFGASGCVRTGEDGLVALMGGEC